MKQCRPARRASPETLSGHGAPECRFSFKHITLSTPRSIKDSLPAAGGRAAAGQDGVPGEGLHMVTVAAIDSRFEIEDLLERPVLPEQNRNL